MTSYTATRRIRCEATTGAGEQQSRCARDANFRAENGRALCGYHYFSSAVIVYSVPDADQARLDEISAATRELAELADREGLAERIAAANKERAQEIKRAAANERRRERDRMKPQTRRTISTSGLTYARLASHCATTNTPIAAFVESAILDALAAAGAPVVSGPVERRRPRRRRNGGEPISGVVIL